MDGIETRYKEIMHAKREVPVSSCPSEIDNLMYASGCLSDNHSKEEWASFRSLMERLDERAAGCESKKTRKHTQSRFAKRLQKGIRDGTWHRVDTDGKFWIGRNQYIIADNEVQYQPVATEYGDYYAMDRILFANGKFYDMNYDEVEVLRIGGIVPYDESPLVGQETV